MTEDVLQQYAFEEGVVLGWEVYQICGRSP
jgi:hypothetical protein